MPKSESGSRTLNRLSSKGNLDAPNIWQNTLAVIHLAVAT